MACAAAMCSSHIVELPLIDCGLTEEVLSAYCPLMGADNAKEE